MDSKYWHVASRTRWGRAERMAQIEGKLIFHPADVHTVNSIAKLIMMKPSTHLRGILADMCTQGKLLCSSQTADDGTVTRRLYALPHRAPQQRPLPLDDFIVYKRGRQGERVLSGFNPDDTPMWSYNQGSAVRFTHGDANVIARANDAWYRRVDND